MFGTQYAVASAIFVYSKKSNSCSTSAPPVLTTEITATLNTGRLSQTKTEKEHPADSSKNPVHRSTAAAQSNDTQVTKLRHLPDTPSSKLSSWPPARVNAGNTTPSPNASRKHKQFQSSLQIITSGGSQKYHQAFKIITLGDYSVGKTRFLRTMSRVNDENTCGCCKVFRDGETADIVFRRNGKRTLVRLMDTGGQERYRSITSSYYRGVHGCLLMFDVTKETTFNDILNWYEDLEKYCSDQYTSAVLVGLTSSEENRKLPSRREVSSQREVASRRMSSQAGISFRKQVTSPREVSAPREFSVHREKSAPKEVSTPREVSTQRARQLAESLGLPYVECCPEDELLTSAVLQKLVDAISNTESYNGSWLASSPHVIKPQSFPEKNFRKTWQLGRSCLC